MFNFMRMLLTRSVYTQPRGRVKRSKPFGAVCRGVAMRPKPTRRTDRVGRPPRGSWRYNLSHGLNPRGACDLTGRKRQKGTTRRLHSFNAHLPAYDRH